VDYLLYGLFFVVMSLFAWGRRRLASPLFYVGLSLFWISFLIQVTGMVVLYYFPTRYSWHMELYTITIGGMMTGAIMMAHSYLIGMKKSIPPK
jgi:hypothetical protein